MKIVIIDDDIAVCSSLRLLMKQSGYEAETFQEPDEALSWLRQHVPALIIMDMNFSIETSGEEGLELLQKVRIFHPNTPIILITGWGSIQLAVEGIKKGASDFITKPWNNSILLKSIESNLHWAQIHNEDSHPDRKALDKHYDFQSIIGEHPSLLEVLNITGKIAASNATVLITGESGTGKELIAEAIHNNSKRKDKPFVKVNLGGISESLFESEMFGHKKGSFTDAVADRVGRFEMAQGGTIFLDEIGDLAPASQVKLLRVLQENTYEILGDSKTRVADVRIVCATNKNLVEAVRKGEFREDLFYRINLIHIQNPALRERPTDIPILASHFIETTAKKHDVPQPALSKEAKQSLKKMKFPGNIRELKNLMERTVLMCMEEKISTEIIEQNLDRYKEGSPSQAPGIETLEEIEKKAILEAMRIYKDNVTRVARALGISRGALYRRLDKHNIPYEH
jgi:DNA-binding NtrC family response regulator